ncbi:hypothetical protein JXA88_00480 [Candidatus Fermentibacteria bacterium]|nr:hypothetical protein [Candidatus Fermentibacteria bacterium]
MARSLSFTDPGLFSHGQWPGGYPAILRFAVLHLGAQPVKVGRVLSWVSAMCAVWAVGRLAVLAGAGTVGCLVAMAVLLANPVFLEMGVTEGTEMPAAALMLLSLIPLAASARTGTVTSRAAFRSGVLLGAAYMFRYTAMVFMPIGVVFVAAGSARRWVATLLFLCGFVIMTFPQLLQSTLAHGNPFFNQLAFNTWLGLNVGEKSPTNWSLAPPDASLFGIVVSDPIRFARHWAGEVWGFLVSGTGWPRAFNALVVASSVMVLACRRISLALRLLLLAAAYGPVFATALAFFIPRHGLVPVLGLSVVTGSGLALMLAGNSLSSRNAIRRTITAAGSLALICLLAHGARSFAGRTTLEFYARLDGLAKDLGIQRERAMTNIGLLVDLENPWLTQYDDLGPPWVALSVEDLLTRGRRKADPAFVIIDHHAFWGDYGSVVLETAAGGSDLIPVYVQDSLGVYMARPGGTGDAAVDSMELAPGVLLLGHTWVWRGERLVVYLYWSATKPLADRCTVDVRLVDADGRKVAAHEGEPELGTYPTTCWEVGKVVADAHILEVPAWVDRGEVEVCLVNMADSSRQRCSLWPVWRGGRTALP